MKTHRMSGTKFYKAWGRMIWRCRHDLKYKNVDTCKRWEKFENFRDDMYKNYIFHVNRFGEKQTTLDRMNGKKGYSLRNCRWSTYREQNSNRSDNVWLKFNGKKMILEHWAKEIGISQSTLRKRLFESCWSIEKALTKPLQIQKTKEKNL